MITNAIVHADYSQIGGPIRLAFFDDRIEVENPGVLLPGLTMEDLMQGVSKIRNRVMARIFRELNLIEQWGSGIRRIFNEAEKLKLPEPKIEEIGMRLRFTVYLGGKSGVESEMAIRILALLEPSALSKKEIAEKMGKTKPNRYLNELVKSLVAEGILQYTVPEKPNSRLQKYQLTDKGKNLLKKRK